ncbi:MAG: acyl-CoA carboxylase subunit beta [Deltaproteobacteria bacterium]|nr:acyl-CoA carboxylase subunit beta [Deltaproteobacteria bacterium]
MSVIQSSVDTRSERFQNERAAMLALVAQLRDLEGRVRANSERSRKKFEKRGQLLPRDRVAQLLDPGRPFFEISTLAGLGMHDDNGKDDVHGGGAIAGVGFVAGKRCLVSATDSGIKGGSVSPMGLKKGLRVQEIALENRLPLVTLAESAGANLLYQDELFVEGGRTFANQARLSAAGIPQITVVHGSSTAGGAYLPGLSDYVVVVRNQSKIFLAGPPLLKAATGEVATDEALGGAVMHTSVAGTAEYLAEDDAHALALARELVDKLPWDEYAPAEAPRSFKPPRYDAEELCGAVPVDYRRPYDVREVVARVVDDSDFLDFKPDYGPHTVCGHARIEGHAVGIIGNNGPIDPAGSTKAAQFIQLCSQAGVPLVFLQNTTGYLVGTDAESGGIVKHGSKMIQAVANATVPKITLVIGGSWGAGNYGMAGRGLSPRFIFSWPNAKVGVMGPEQAGTVLEIITREKMMKQMGQEPPQDFLDALKNEVVSKMEPQTSVFYGTARLWDDGVIDPRDSRKVLATCLAVCREAARRTLNPITFGAARL